jgi:AcrR family transcriptional regulator
MVQGMAHREDLLEGAKRCLLDKGWTRTTARDIVAASGANLASIGYHYGSKDELMGQAYLALIEEWGDRVGKAAGMAGDGADPLARKGALWGAMMDAMGEDRKFWAAQLEVIGQLEHNEKLRSFFVEAMPLGWEGMVELFEGIPEGEVPPEDARTVGWVYSALWIGMWTQRLIDPSKVPSGAEVAESLRRIVAGEAAPRSGPEEWPRGVAPRSDGAE